MSSVINLLKSCLPVIPKGECTICKKGMKRPVSKCDSKHLFHQQCLEQWFSTVGKSCPGCIELRPERVKQLIQTRSTDSINKIVPLSRTISSDSIIGRMWDWDLIRSHFLNLTFNREFEKEEDSEKDGFFTLYAHGLHYAANNFDEEKVKVRKFAELAGMELYQGVLEKAKSFDYEVLVNMLVSN